MDDTFYRTFHVLRLISLYRVNQPLDHRFSLTLWLELAQVRYVIERSLVLVRTLQKVHFFHYWDNVNDALADVTVFVMETYLTHLQRRL